MIERKFYKMEKKILDVLESVNEDIISYNGENLFDAGILDSIQAVNIIAALEDELDIEIDAEYVTEENLKTKEAIATMVKKILNRD